ncbi:RND family efflux transporter MFP subunit [Sphaerotilus hippei]|uniref:RND family efflux transporter MFP subunit n=1 Tax=Sphaerotilus hippei TaxID=744406 RepID=A0A318GYD0_9BURK|nr:efflux RND transporter periplasmic adaptor subunit [Sphaerotilus hippei]PXW95037.1 RND family efflux transporter MFP subunit [Sphaerotilus hippei]
MHVPLRLVPGVLVLSLLAACSGRAPEVEPIRAVRTVKVGEQEVRAVREYGAEVRARTESRLGFRVGGKLLRRSVDLGDSVRAGQTLAQLDASDLRLGADAAQAAVRAAQAAHAQAAADFRRYQELRVQGFIGEAELERRETALKAAQSDLEQAKAQAGVQGNQAAYASLVADAAGVITAVEVEPGAVVAAGTPIVRLAHDGPRDVVFSVPEDRQAAMRRLLGRAGALEVVPWGADQAPMAATVREVAGAADAATRTFLVKADIGRADVRLGQTATVRVPGESRAGSMRLPLTALFEARGGSAVWVLDAAAMVVRQQPVQIAGADGNEVLIASGLSAGQEVVTAGVHVLTAGQKVLRHVDRGAAAAAPATPASR